MNQQERDALFKVRRYLRLSIGTGCLFLFIGLIVVPLFYGPSAIAHDILTTLTRAEWKEGLRTEDPNSLYVRMNQLLTRIYLTNLPVPWVIAGILQITISSLGLRAVRRLDSQTKQPEPSNEVNILTLMAKSKLESSGL